MLCLFNKSSLGIDISDSRILVTRLKKTGGNIMVDSCQRIDLPSGVVVNSHIIDREKLSDSFKIVLNKIKAESGCDKKIVFGLPKDKVFVHLFTSEKDITQKETRLSIEKLIREDVEKSIPLSASDIYYSYKILSDTSARKKFLIVAVSRNLLQEWQDFFITNGVDVQVYDLSSQATYRNLFKKMPKNPLCVLDIGSDFTSFTVFNSEGLRYSHAIRAAGKYFNQIISQDLNIELDEAEKLKIKEGIVKKSKAYQSLEKGFEPIINTAREIFDFVFKQTGEKVEKIIIVGGSSLMKGVEEYLSTYLQVPVEIGKPLILKNKADFEFLNSTGLALRGLEKRIRQTDPGLSPLSVDKKNIKEKKLPVKTINSLSAGTQRPVIDYEKLATERKIKRQKILLLLVLFFGLILIAGAYWYRYNQNLLKQTQKEKQETPFNKSETISLKIPVAIERQAYMVDRVKGRITESTENELVSGEKIWSEPIKTDPNRWLIYSETDLKSLVIAQLKQARGSNFSLDSIEVLKIDSGLSEEVYFFSVEATIYLL